MSHYLKPSNPLLNKRSNEIPVDKILSGETQEIIEQMLTLAQGERTDPSKRSLIGLAAPQIGISKRIILVDIGVDEDRKKFGELKAFINPQIIWSSSELISGREGCFSVDAHVCGIVSRPHSIEIKAFDRQGNAIHEKIEGFTARIFQHEIDHLDGIRFPDRIGEKGALHWIETDQFLEYRKNWQNWPVKCPWKIWIAMRAGKPYEAVKK
jgi:peptide deformylase